jgi:sphingosine kinase
MFLLGNIKPHVVETQYAGHAGEVASHIDLSQYDGIITVSGDGLLHEVVNGILRREDWAQAVTVPLGIVPGGSGNGLAASIGCFTPRQAAFAIARGGVRRLDAFSVLQEGKARRYGFLDVAWGFISDVDFESERMRWLGAPRFTVTAVEKLVENKPYRARLALVEAPMQNVPCLVDHCTVCATCASQHPHLPTPQTTQTHTDKDQPTNQGPPLYWISKEALSTSAFSHPKPDQKKPQREPTPKAQTQAEALGQAKGKTKVETDQEAETEAEAEAEAEGNAQFPEGTWETIEDEYSLLLISNVKGISSDTFLTPYAHLSDGCLDVCYMRKASRKQLAEVLLASQTAEGKHLDCEGFIYRKARAVVLHPLPSSPSRPGKMGIDGEEIAPSPVAIEVHPALLSLFHPLS